MNTPRRKLLLSPAAEQDLSDIWDYSAETWSTDQADEYLRGLEALLGLLSERPNIARERQEFDPPVRVHQYRSHLVIFEASDDRLHLIRVMHARQHWQAYLTESPEK